MKHKLYSLLAILTGALTFFLTSCSSNSPSDANFKSAIEAALNKNVYSENCIRIVLNDRTEQDYQKDTLLQALVQQGYITATKVAAISSSWHPPGEPGTPGYKLALTDTGKKMFRDDYFCFGNIVVTKIENYTLANAPSTGEKWASVTYDYQIEGKPDWLSTQLVTSTGWGTSPITLTLSGQNKNMDLIQGEKGWYHQ